METEKHLILVSGFSMTYQPHGLPLIWVTAHRPAVVVKKTFIEAVSPKQLGHDAMPTFAVFWC